MSPPSRSGMSRAPSRQPGLPAGPRRGTPRAPARGRAPPPAAFEPTRRRRQVAGRRAPPAPDTPPLRPPLARQPISARGLRARVGAPHPLSRNPGGEGGQRGPAAAGAVAREVPLRPRLGPELGCARPPSPRPAPALPSQVPRQRRSSASGGRGRVAGRAPWRAGCCEARVSAAAGRGLARRGRAAGPGRSCVVEKVAAALEPGGASGRACFGTW